MPGKQPKVTIFTKMSKYDIYLHRQEIDEYENEVDDSTVQPVMGLLLPPKTNLEPTQPKLYWNSKR